MTPRTRRDRRALRACYAVLALFVFATWLSTRAHADPVDDGAFIDTLNHFGVAYSTPAKAIALGRDICLEFDHGMSFNAAGVVLVESGWSAGDAGTIIGAAIGSYCPEPREPDHAGHPAVQPLRTDGRMSAIVTVPDPANGIGQHKVVDVTVSAGNGYDLDKDGTLHIKTSAWSGDRIAVFKDWFFVVITPNRGPDGRFVKRDNA